MTHPSDIILTPKEVAALLRVSISYVYRNKHHLGGVQFRRCGKLMFSENRILEIMRSGNAIPGQDVRQVPGNQNDQRGAKNQILQDQDRSKKVGSPSKRRELDRRAAKLGLTSLLEWSVRYLEYSKERHTRKTYKSEKLAAFIRLFVVVDRDTLVDDLTVADCLRVLDKQAKERSGNAANKDKKNLKAAWNWGVKYLGMPKDNPFAEVDSFPAVKRPRYVPSQGDFWKVFDVAEGEDKTLLLAFLHTAARRNELLSLKWDDVDLDSGKIRLWTRKRKGGAFEYDWLPLTAELAGALTEHAKSKRSEYVFCDRNGMPYAERQR